MLATSRHLSLAVVHLPSQQDRYSRHLDLLPLVAQSEYSFTRLHSQGGLVSEKTSSQQFHEPHPLPHILTEGQAYIACLYETQGRFFAGVRG
jgi:hypothetical protein